MWSLEYNQVPIEETRDNSTGDLGNSSRKSLKETDNKDEIMTTHNEDENPVVPSTSSASAKKIELIKQMSNISTHDDNGMYEKKYSLSYSRPRYKKDYKKVRGNC